MMNYFNWDNLDKAEKESILKRSDLIANPKIHESVNQIMIDVRDNGDTSVAKYASEFDGYDSDTFEVGMSTINNATNLISKELKDSIDQAWKNIRKYHEAQPKSDFSLDISEGITCGAVTRAIESIGVYIPSGTAPLISTAIMVLVPASIANIPKINLFSPSKGSESLHPGILYVASKLNNVRVFNVGGPQAVAAMTFGTEQLPKVNKIFGPGNAYVTEAKKLANSMAVMDIDMPAGPSEVMIFADEFATPEYVTSDLLSQCEHGVDSQSILVTSSQNLFESIGDVITSQVKGLSRQKEIESSLSQSKVILVSTEKDAINIINEYAPEHLIINTQNYNDILDRVTNAGSVFLGQYSPETAGDYCSGTNHVLPTSGYASCISGLSVKDFQKVLQIQELTLDGLKSIEPTIKGLSDAEGLDAHYAAVQVRVGNDDN
jgi:histidinol dehydrogenase